MNDIALVRTSLFDQPEGDTVDLLLVKFSPLIMSLRCVIEVSNALIAFHIQIKYPRCPTVMASLIFLRKIKES